MSNEVKSYTYLRTVIVLEPDGEELTDQIESSELETLDTVELNAQIVSNETTSEQYQNITISNVDINT